MHISENFMSHKTMERFEINVRQLKPKANGIEIPEFHENNFEVTAKWPRSFTLFKHRCYLDEGMIRHALKHYRKKNYEWSFEDMVNNPSVLTVKIDILSFQWNMIHEEDIDKIARELNSVKEERLKIMKEINFFNYYHINKSSYFSTEIYCKNFGERKLKFNPIYKEAIDDPTNLYTILHALGKYEDKKEYCFGDESSLFNQINKAYYIVLDQPLSTTLAKMKSPLDQVLMSNGKYYVEVFLSKQINSKQRDPICIEDNSTSLVKINPKYTKKDTREISNDLYYHEVEFAVDSDCDYILYLPKLL